MSKAMQDEQLIFMISLPRSGSTLLQKILGGHSDIYTRSEPWLMLHPLYALKSEGIQARYNSRLAAQGVHDFISCLPEDGESYYYERLRECYLSLYAPYLDSSGKSRFLDKTPRYYEVFDELQKTFPKAKFIILYRNPLAVLASILGTWVKDDYAKINEYSGDLYNGVAFLQRDFSAYKNTHTIRYEELLLNPQPVVESLFNFLQLPNQPECIEYGNQPLERWKYGDPTTVYEKSRPDPLHVNAWHEQLAIPKNRKLLSDYLHNLGETCFQRMGYSFVEAERVFLDKAQITPTTDTTPSFLPTSTLLSAADENKQLREKISAFQAHLKKVEQQLSAKDIEIQNLDTLLHQKDLQTAHLEKNITHLLAASDTLKKYKAILHPKKKFAAYRDFLSTVEACRTEHGTTPPLSATQTSEHE